MNKRLVRLTLLLLSALMGWAFGFIKVPYIESNYSFWVGFVGCIGMLAFVSALFGIWKNNKIIKYFEFLKKPETDTSKQKITSKGILFSLLFIALLSICIHSYFKIQRINKLLIHANAELNEVKYNENLEQQRNKLALLLGLINNLDSTKINIQDKKAVDSMIDRIVTLSSSFKIHKVWDMENNVIQNLSTERGLLLLALINTKMDSNLFEKIIENVSFFGADLRNADFHGLNLNGIDLKYANLEYANLEGTNLNNANLNGASLIGANLNHASLVAANLISAKLNWAKINEADLQMAKLDSANLSNATLHKSKLNEATLIQSVLCNAIFIEADLSLCTLVSTNISNTNFSQAILINADIHRTNLSGAILNDAIIQQDWIERLREKNNININNMLAKYQIELDSMFIQDSIIYLLKPKTY